MGKKIAAKTFILLALLAALMFSGCSDGVVPKYKDVNYFQGSDGIVMELTNEDALDEIYEGSNFAFSLSLENKGAYSVVGEEQAILTLGYDPFYIEVDREGSKSNQMTFGKSSAVAKGLNLIGRSRYYPAGSKVFFYFPYFKTKNVTGQRATPETQLFASLCYPYSTTLSAVVCIDFDVYQDDARSQVCRQSDLSFSDQGAPVAVTLVEVDNLPVKGNLVRPVYIVHLQNVGQGTVMSSNGEPSEAERICLSQDLQKQDFNTVRIEAWLSNNIKLDCTPETIKLTAEEGISRCTVADEDIENAISWRQNYQAPLTVNLSYLYMSTIRKYVEIKRINPYGALGNGSTGGCAPFQMLSDGECVSKCDYCADSKNQADSLCSPRSAKYEIEWNSDFSCKCSSKSCDRLYPQGLCMPFSSFCPPASYCCSNACSSGELRDEESGECFSKCAICSEIKKACICGDEESKTLVSELGGFCSEDRNVYGTPEECRSANTEFNKGNETSS